jgi:hypothetical protein
MPSQPPRFDANFFLTIVNASLDFNPQDPNDFYYNFITYFGTHFTYVIHMGGKFGRVSQFSGSQWSSLQGFLLSSGVSVRVASSFDALQASGSTLSGSQEQIAQYFSYQAMKQTEFTVGARPPINGSVDEWVSDAQFNPMPLWYTLIPLHELLTPQYFPHDPNIGIKQKNLFNAMYNYCPNLLAQGAVKTCSAPTPKNSTYTTVLQFTPNITTDTNYAAFGMNTLPGLSSVWNGQTLTITGDYLSVDTTGQYPISYIILYTDTHTYDNFTLYLNSTYDPIFIVNIWGNNWDPIWCTNQVFKINSDPVNILCYWNYPNYLSIEVTVTEN